ncbi:MAG: Bax inhibitor-1/YccA family protein [Holosporaceae bacterium]|nr:Bax inhibitor-1/YccA family protein [Holosporaceae bacterium]
MKDFGYRIERTPRYAPIDAAAVGTGAYSAGLRTYISQVFAYVLAGLALCFGIAIFAPTCGWYAAFMQQSAMGLGVAWIVMSISFNFAFPYLSLLASICWFLLDVSILGLLLSPITMVYTSVSLITTFLVTTSMFLSIIIYGYATKKDLVGFVPLMIMGFVGVLLASIINMFMGSSTFSLMISAVAIMVIAAYTAYTMQLIKGLYSEDDSGEVRGKKIIFGASLVFHEFINLFLHILRFIGRNRS